MKKNNTITAMNVLNVKLLIVTGTLLLIAQQAAAQKLDSSAHQYPQYNFKYYSKKRNSYNTAGWICLGAGATLGAFGSFALFGGAFNSALSGNHYNASGATAVAITGEVIALISIPLFIIAHHNKKKAHLLFQRESVIINNKSLLPFKYNAIAFTIQF